MPITCSYCDKEATSYCIVEDGVVACDEHVVGDYFWEFDLIPQVDGSLFCDKCESTIRVIEPQVLELHQIKCEEWAQLNEARRIAGKS